MTAPTDEALIAKARRFAAIPFPDIDGDTRELLTLLADRLEARPEVTVTDEMVEAGAQSVCRIHRLKVGEGACTVICMEQIDPPSGCCRRTTDVYGDIVRAALEAALQCAPGGGWQPIETAPKDGTRILMFTSEGITQGHYMEAEPDQPDSMGCDAGWMSYDGFSFPGRSFGNPNYFCEPQGQPTHWMPLPPPPEKEPR